MATEQPDILPLLEASNLKWLRANTILLTKHGSQAYGTATPTSDTDFKGICIEPPEFLLGMSQAFYQAEYHKPDAVIYSLRKFMKLAADCNPSIIEVLFTDESDWVIGSPTWRACVVNSDQEWALKQLMAARELFLSRKARWTFAGYAMSQLKRIRTHHRWLERPPTHKPARSEFGLPEKTVIPFDQLLAAEAGIRKEMDALYNVEAELDAAGDLKLKDGIDALKARVSELIAGSSTIAVGKVMGFDTNFLLLLDHERQYKNAAIEWDQYQEWKAKRNADRAALETKFGYDTKHAMHLVRLMRMGVEILQGKGVIVKRPDALELLEIRGGAWTYEQLVAWAEAQEKLLEQLYETSPLPKAPDHVCLEKLCQNLYEDYLYGVFRKRAQP